MMYKLFFESARNSLKINDLKNSKISTIHLIDNQ